MRTDPGIVEAALREHARARVEVIGEPRVKLGRWIATVAIVAATCSIALSTGAVISGEVKASPKPSLAAGKLSPGLVIPPLYDVPKGEDEIDPSRTSRLVPYLTQEFFEVAADAMRHNSGLSEEETRDILDRMEDAGQNCIKSGIRSNKCVFESNGVRLDFEELIYTVTYERYSWDGAIDLGDRIVGAVQKGNTVEVTADPFKRSFPVPEQQP